MDEMQEKIIYFVRHGQSNDNIAPVFQSPDSPLSKKGKQQAESIAERVSKLNFESLIASPFERTKQTAEAIAKATGKKTEYSELFVERIKPTYINGKSYTDEKADKLWREWEKSLYTPGLRVEDGENYDDIVARADEALDFLKNRKEKEIVVITHGFFLRTMIVRVALENSLTPKAFQNFQARVTMENTGLSVLKYGKTYEGTAWRLWIYNDHAHLG